MTDPTEPADSARNRVAARQERIGIGLVLAAAAWAIWVGQEPDGAENLLGAVWVILVAAALALMLLPLTGGRS